MDKREPTKKQLNFCYKIFKKIGEAPANENGQPVFEISFSEADKFIKKNLDKYNKIMETMRIKKYKYGTPPIIDLGDKNEDHYEQCPSDYGIPNH